MMWKQVPDFPDYMVSDRGDVLSFKHGRPRKRKFGGHPYGYPMFTLCKNGTTKTICAHRLVLLAFRGEPAPGMWARHLNGNPRDNRLSNLEWATPSENATDTVRHGHNRAAKLNPQKVRRIRHLAGKFSSRALGEMFGVSHTQILQTIKRVWWKHVD